MAVKIVRGAVPSSGDSVKPSQGAITPQTNSQQAGSNAPSLSATALAQAVSRSVVTHQASDAVVNAVRGSIRPEREGSSLKSFDKAAQVASEVRDEILKGDAKSAEGSHAGLRSGSAAHHLV